MNKKIRFEVFKRDGFQCAYCGKTPPEVMLEVDHIEPVSLGGNDDINNLITACFDCNRGKTNIPLDKIPNKLVENLEILKEKEEQLEEYRKLLTQIDRRIEVDIDKIEKIFQDKFENLFFTDDFRNSVKRFVIQLPINIVEEAMSWACAKCNTNPKDATKYFCGICWKKIRGDKQ